MQTPDTQTCFAGVDGRTATEIPAWYAATHDLESQPVPSFAEAIRSLPRAIATGIAYRNPATEAWVPTDRFNALVDPSRLAGDDADDPLFHVPTDSYEIINPLDVYSPLEELLRETSVDGRALGEVVFGTVRQYRGGGEVHMDILFDGLEVTLPGRTEPITMGVTSGYDFFGGHAVYVEGFAQDTRCANSIRRLTDREAIKHVGEVNEFRGWWETILSQLELVSDDLAGFIRDAEAIDLDFTDLPFGVADFYELLGFPEYLAGYAGRDARANAANPFAIDLWTLHSGATHALTHFYRGREGASLDRYVRVANDLLFNPETTIETVEAAYEQQAAAETTDDGQTGLESQVALAQLERVGQDLREKAIQFEAREAELRRRFEDTPE